MDSNSDINQRVVQKALDADKDQSMLLEQDEDKELVHTRQIVCRGYRRKHGPVWRATRYQRKMHCMRARPARMISE